MGFNSGFKGLKFVLRTFLCLNGKFLSLCKVMVVFSPTFYATDHLEGATLATETTAWWRNLWHAETYRGLRPGTHYLHVTWVHVILRVRLGCEWRYNIEFCGADSHFCHSAYVTWSHVEVWSAHVQACLSDACWHVSRPELHVRSRDVSRVTQVWL